MNMAPDTSSTWDLKLSVVPFKSSKWTWTIEQARCGVIVKLRQGMVIKRPLQVCRVTMGHLKASVVNIRVTLGHLRVTLGYF